MNEYQEILDSTKKEKVHNRSNLVDKKENKNLNENKEKETKKPASNMRMNIGALFIIILGTICYLITLIGCPDTQAECLKNFDQTKIKYFAMILMLSAFLYTMIYNLTIYRCIHYSISIFLTVLIWYLCFVYDTGTDLKSHGQYNRTLLFALMVFFFVLQNFIIVLFYFIRRKVLISLIVSTLIFGVLVVIFYYKLQSSCSNWTKGLKDSEIINSNEGCDIKIPKYCWMNMFDNLFDVSGWLGENCEQIRMDSREQVLRWTRYPNAKRIGYPRTEKYKFYPDTTLDVFQFKVLSQIIDMDDPKIPKSVKDRTELIVDFKKEKPDVEMRIAVDETLIENRKKIMESFKTKLMSKNVIFLFIDSLSRDNFNRKLPKTKKWLEKYYRNTESEAQVFQFFKFHSIASWTIINMIPAHFGVDWHHKGSPNHINKYFKERGFITGQSHTYCSRELYDLENGPNSSYLYEPFDHESNLLFCDPNFSVPGHPFAVLNGPYGMKRRCLYGKDSNTYVFDYGKKFWKAYKNESKFARMAFLDAHEGTGEVVKYMDNNLVDFFEFLEKEGSLKDTTILFLADHGMNMPGFYSLLDCEDFWIEKTLPFLFLITPQDIAKEYGDVLKEKENLLLSPYDIHNTFLTLASAPKSAYNKVGISLFDKITDVNQRNCDKFRVVDPYCNCVGERDE